LKIGVKVYIIGQCSAIKKVKHRDFITKNPSERLHALEKLKFFT
jgi:hypothetical protein